MSEKEIIIDGIDFKIGEKTLRLTVGEAQRLHEVLGKMFSEKIVYQPGLPFIYPRWGYPQDPILPWVTYTVSGDTCLITADCSKCT